MAGGDWRGFAMEEAELLSGRLKDLLSSGQAYVRSHLGLDLGLAPELYPTWLMLATAGMGALLLLAVSWAAICGGVCRSKRSIRVVTRSGPPVAKTPVTKTVKPEETKKRNAKKAGEKQKLQPNGKPAAALVVQQEVKVPQVLSKLHPPSTKTRKAPEAQPPVQLKKDKKKSKISVKPAQYVITHDGKELDEGAWETKVSNREKKQQRRKDKGADSFSGQEGTHAAQSHVESNSNVKKKNKGANDSQNSKSASKASSSQGGNGINGGGWSDFSAMVPSTHMGSTEPSKFGSHYRTRAEPRSWSQESQGGAQTWVASIKSDRDPVSLSMVHLNATPDPLSKSVDLHWTTHADDEWGGTKGADPGSDWNAPAEHWGNYEEPPVVTRLLTQLKQRTSTNKVSENSDDPAEGATKSKKKRKKKTTSKEEGIPAAQAVNSLPKPEDLPVAASKKPSVSSSSRKRPEKNAGSGGGGGGDGKKRQEKVLKSKRDRKTFWMETDASVVFQHLEQDEH